MTDISVQTVGYEFVFGKYGKIECEMLPKGTETIETPVTSKGVVRMCGWDERQSGNEMKGLGEAFGVLRYNSASNNVHVQMIIGLICEWLSMDVTRRILYHLLEK